MTPLIKEIFLYLSIPLSSGIIGWFTNIMAIKMTFYPLDYIGIRPIGWQGIIPSNARKMSDKAVDLLTTNLLKIDEHFSQLDPEFVAKEMQASLLDLTRKTVDEVMMAEAPAIWEKTPQKAKQVVYDTAGSNIPSVVTKVMEDIGGSIKEMLDLKMLTLEAVSKDKRLLNTIFIKCGKEEFKFIEKSGFYFGSLFGITQMVIAYFYNPWWLLPLFGVIVGYATNWLALKLIFEPKKPIKVGPWTLLGLFLKRQKEVADEYSTIITERILTTERIFQYISRTSGRDRLKEILEHRLGELIDSTYDKVKDPVEIWVESEDAQKHLGIIKSIALFRFMQEFHICLEDIYPYADKTLNIRNILREKMEQLPYEDFEGFLRPAFQEDEMTLIIVGAILGGCAGALQFILLFS
ncbi:hypothetical protein V6R21_15975 [Limibacter armeniacum]|uniref:DUF445 domain-containing protein n=1 Tax=Limibacter armeniacum TaxID=466084 RepID=UPI002FE63E37